MEVDLLEILNNENLSKEFSQVKNSGKKLVIRPEQTLVKVAFSLIKLRLRLNKKSPFFMFKKSGRVCIRLSGNCLLGY
ncbi:hypothetical protein [Peribacillus sp. Bi134]|uniref:hypothetical protein n=1 Tax=Peribacillus sp. Bi134 TaxID=2884272 RepID=UPI001D4B0A2A|nr:hypothetical protein [Peribacillus sp. Bi134]CAH0212881.1 hypothetical protein SRABI134_02277 [Peribacillus sp. Bi134]